MADNLQLNNFYTWRNNDILATIFDSSTTVWDWGDLTIDSSNNIYYCYQWDDDGVRLRKYDDKLTNELADIAIQSVGSGNVTALPRLTIDNNDNKHVVHAINTYGYFSHEVIDNNDNKSEYEMVLNLNEADGFDICCDNSYVYLLGIYKNDCDLYLTKFYEGTIVDETKVYSGSLDEKAIGCDIDSDGNIHVVAFNNSGDLVYIRTDTSGNLIEDMTLENNVKNAFSWDSFPLGVEIFNDEVHITFTALYKGSVGSTPSFTYYMRLSPDITSLTKDESIIVPIIAKPKEGYSIALGEKGMYLADYGTNDSGDNYLGIRFLEPITNSGHLEDLLFTLTP
jgi:hypothetical protein